jgi:hypothetical protein
MVQFYFEIPNDKLHPYLDENFFQCSRPQKFWDLEDKINAFEVLVQISPQLQTQEIHLRTIIFNAMVANRCIENCCWNTFTASKTFD